MMILRCALRGMRKGGEGVAELVLNGAESM